MRENQKIHKPKRDKTGESYGHWIVKEFDPIRTEETRHIYWLCECDCGCGLQKSIRADALYQVTIGGCDKMRSNQGKECAKCKKIFYPKKGASTRKYCYECVPESFSNGAQQRKFIKQWAVEYKGNKCECCGYNKCIEALEFHHLNPEEKDFNISDRDIKLNWEEIKKEIDKCILVCSNCHREIHNGLRTNDGKEVSNENAN